MGKQKINAAISAEWGQLQLQLDALIKQGKHEQARHELELKNPKSVPREFAVQFGELAFRCHLPLFTLKILHPFVHPENEFSITATDKEKMIYATAIFSLGAVNDAILILNTINPQQEPEAHFYKALAHVCDWNYAASIPHLKAYIQSEATPDYRKLVGKVNLAAGLIQIENWELADQTLEQIKTQCQRDNHVLLLGNCYELKSQLEFYQGRYDQALNFLEQAAVHLKDQQGRYSMLVEKGMMLCQLFKSKQDCDFEQLKTFQGKAGELGHWDSIRDTDLFAAIVSEDEALTRKVIVGTPSEHYRQRARKLFGQDFKLNGNLWWFLPKAGSSSNEIEKQNCLQFDPYKQLHDNPMLLNLFDALTCDFYKPANLGFLFQKIYSDEKFNPFTSPSRVLQLLRRLDAVLTKQNSSLRIVFKKSEFQLQALEDTNILVRRGKVITSYAAVTLKLKEHFDGRSFTPTKACQALNISKSSIHRIINEALSEGGLTKVGLGRGVNYRFARTKKLKEAA